jgi:hypothetical protein
LVLKTLRGLPPPPTPALPHKGGGSQIQALPPCGGGLGGGMRRGGWRLAATDFPP